MSPPCTNTAYGQPSTNRTSESASHAEQLRRIARPRATGAELWRTSQRAERAIEHCAIRARCSRRRLRASRRGTQQHQGGIRARCSRRRRSAEGADETTHRERSWPLRNRRFVGSDEDGGYLANIAASGASHRTQRARRARQSSRIPRCCLGRAWEQAALANRPR
jgi:hypothetical protein